MINDGNIEIIFREDRPKGGMWHCGPNPWWVTVTHLPTMQSVTAYGRIQHEVRGRALSLLDLLLGELCGTPNFPEVMAPKRETAE